MGRGFFYSGSVSKTEYKLLGSVRGGGERYGGRGDDRKVDSDMKGLPRQIPESKLGDKLRNECVWGEGVSGERFECARQGKCESHGFAGRCDEKGVLCPFAGTKCDVCKDGVASSSSQSVIFFTLVLTGLEFYLILANTSRGRSLPLSLSLTRIHSNDRSSRCTNRQP